MAKLRFAQKVSRALELPADAALPVPRLEITGRDDVLVTGDAVLLDFSPEEIRVGRKNCTVTIRGEKLEIAAMDRMGMQIFGAIECVEFEGSGGGR